MGPLDTFIWGSIGGLIAYLFVFLLPWAMALWRSSATLQFSGSRFFLALLIAVVFVGLGGAAAFLIGDAPQPKHAMAYGMGFEGILGGVIGSAE